MRQPLQKPFPLTFFFVPILKEVDPKESGRGEVKNSRPFLPIPSYQDGTWACVGYTWPTPSYQDGTWAYVGYTWPQGNSGEGAAHTG